MASPAAALNDLQLAWLATQGYSNGSLSDRWFYYLGALGYTGSLNDRLYAWFGDLMSGDVPFVPTPYNKSIVSTLAYESPREPDGATFFTYSGTRYMAAICNTTGIVWKESSVFPGTFGRRNVFGTLPSTHTTSEGEGMAYGVVGGLPYFVVGDQNNAEVWGYTPPGSDLMVSWTRSTGALYAGAGPYPGSYVHTVVAHDWDGDGDDEFIFCDEANGGVFILDYDGSGSLTDPANWTTFKIATLAAARTVAQHCPADLMGNGRGDMVILCRSNSAGPKAYILTAPPAASATSTTWTATGLTGYTYTVGAMWGCLFDATGSGERKDIATFDRDAGDPHYWLHSEGYSTIHYLPDPSFNPAASPAQQAFQLFAVPDPSGPNKPDIVVYTYGTAAAGSFTNLELFRWNGSGWDDLAAETFEYGHALESRPIFTSITGITDRGETLMSDSGGSTGGQRMALFSFYDSGNVRTKTAPSVVHKGQNTSSTTSVGVTLDGTPTNGNLLIGIVTASTTLDTITPPAGWEPVSLYVADTGFQVFMKVAASDVALSTWTRSPNTGTFHVSVLEVSGADTTNPILNHRARKRPSGTNVSIDNPSIGLDENGVLVIGCWAFSNAQASAPTYPTGFTQHTFTGGQRRHATASKQFSASGETGSLAATAVSATTGTAFSLAIRGA